MYNVKPGDTSINNMVAVPSTVFDTDNVKLRVIFNDGVHGEETLAPDQRVTSGAYAYHAGDADTLNGATAAQLAPSGIIVMWSGTIATIPAGWSLCDGSNGTPDLRDRFIVGAREDDAGIAKTKVKGTPMKTGGEHEHVLTISEMPSHSHSKDYPGEVILAAANTTIQNFGAKTKQTGSTGGDHPHENCPPFFALAFIMKL